jgi:UrcA family protein
MGRIALIAITAVMLFASQRTCAEPAAAPPSVRVSFADLDLSSEAGAQAMLSRIRRAAAQACQQVSTNVGPDFEAMSRFDACRRGAIERSVRKLAAPVVSALYDDAPALRRTASAE